MIDDPIETREYLGCTLEMYPDENPISPRNWSNITTIVSPKQFLAHEDGDLNWDKLDNESWHDYYQKIKLDYDVIVYRCLTFHDGRLPRLGATTAHSESVKNAAGFILVTQQRANEMGHENLSEEKAVEYMNNELEVFEKYIKGEVYGWKVVGPNGHQVDSCWGFFDHEHLWGAARRSAAHYVYSELDEKLRHSQKPILDRSDLITEDDIKCLKQTR